jgi:Zn-dependent M28 family amino/carboxypeptidase
MDLKQPIGALVCACLMLPSMAARGHAASVEALNAAARSITADELSNYVGALADDTFEGREAGSRGNRAAAGYIVDRLQKLGLHGGAEKGGYFQTFGSYRNILARIDGSDPALAKEVIVIGAHYDHVGYGNNRNSYGPIGRIHNGADDNASGVAGLLEVIDAVVQLSEPPKRTIVFAFWDGEEKGLLGSQHWVDHPTIELSRVKLLVNIDMIGRMRKDSIQVFGSRTMPGLRRIVSRQNSADLALDFTWQIRPDSDHHSFFARSIPFIMPFTGIHEDYHRPSDDAEKINVAGLAQISQLIFKVLVDLADAPSLAPFRAASRSDSPWSDLARSRALLLPPGRLGVRWDEAISAQNGQIVVASVTPDSAAARAGVQVGDRFLKFAGRDVNGADTFRLLVLAAENPVPAMVERKGADAPVDITLELTGGPTRLGISWRTDEAEPGTVIINRVIPGSAAALAGVRVGDRVYSVNGQSFADAEEFRRLAASAPAPVALETERSGRVRNVELPVVDLEQPDNAASN